MKKFVALTLSFLSITFAYAEQKIPSVLNPWDIPAGTLIVFLVEVAVPPSSNRGAVLTGGSVPCTVIVKETALKERILRAPSRSFKVSAAKKRDDNNVRYVLEDEKNAVQILECTFSRNTSLASLVEGLKSSVSFKFPEAAFETGDL